MDREMMRALEADGEKLRQLTGEDHGPYFLTETAGGVTALDLAWERINALGGVPTNDIEEAITATVTQALDIIEALGGSDPAPKRHAWRSQQERGT